jgi:hypothetical protein
MIQLKPQVAPNFPDAPDSGPVQDTAADPAWSAALEDSSPAQSVTQYQAKAGLPKPGLALGPGVKAGSSASTVPKAKAGVADDFSAILQALAGVPVPPPTPTTARAASALVTGPNPTSGQVSGAVATTSTTATTAVALGTKAASNAPSAAADKPDAGPAAATVAATPPSAPGLPTAKTIPSAAVAAPAMAPSKALPEALAKTQTQPVSQGSGQVQGQVPAVKAATNPTATPVQAGGAGSRDQAEIPADPSSMGGGDGKGPGPDTGSKDGGDSTEPKANPKLIQLAQSPAPGASAAQAPAPAAAQVDNSPKASAALAQPALPPSAAADLRAGLRSLLPVPEGQTVKMTVSTQGLGEVTITLREQSGSLIATLQASTPQGQELLRGSSTQITNIFREEGQSLAKLELPATAPSSGGNQLGMDARQGQPDRDSQTADQPAAKDDTAAPAFVLEELT